MEVWRSSEADLESTQNSISSFDSDPEEAFIDEGQKGTESDELFEKTEFIPRHARANACIRTEGHY